MSGAQPSRVPCHYCGRLTYKRGARPADDREDQMRTRDHVIPRARGGAGGRMVPCCYRCNQAKAHYPYEDFKLFADLMLRGAKWRSASDTFWAFEAFIAGRLLG